MQSLLLNLRLCALKDVSELTRLPEFLNNEEQRAVEWHVNEEVNNKVDIPNTLCQVTEPRRPLRYERTCVFLTRSMMGVPRRDLTDFCIFRELGEIDVSGLMENYITVNCIKDMYITKISGLAPIQTGHGFEVGQHIDGSYNVMLFGEKYTFSASVEMWEIRLVKPLFIAKSPDPYHMLIELQFEAQQRFLKVVPEQKVNMMLAKKGRFRIFKNIVYILGGDARKQHNYDYHFSYAPYRGRDCPEFVFVKSLSFCFANQKDDQMVI